MAKFTILAVLAIGFGCSDKNSDSTGENDADTDADSDSDTDTEPTDATFDWSTGSVDVTIVGGSGPYDVGFYETGTDAWQAESCMGLKTAGYGPFCHTAQGSDTTTIPCVDVADDVTNGTTLFCGTVDKHGNSDFITYYIGDESWCAVHGPDAADYTSMGCETW